jgi:hypothetical protein
MPFEDFRPAHPMLTTCCAGSVERVDLLITGDWTPALHQIHILPVSGFFFQYQAE